jgi:hypothetical protein
MASRGRSKTTRAVIVAGLVAGFGCCAWAQDAATVPVEEPHTAVLSRNEEIGDSDAEDADGYLFTPISLSELPEGARLKPFIFSAWAEHQFETNIDTAGDFSVSRAVGGGGMMFPLGRRAGGIVGGAYSYAAYDFDDAAVFGDDEPWGDVQTIPFAAVFKYMVDENWAIIGGGVGAFAGETGAATSSSFTGGGLFGGGYRSDDFHFQLGVSVVSQLEDDPQVLPVFRLNWEIDDQWRIHAGVVETGAADTVGVGVIYDLDRHWSLGVRAGYVSRRFRLDDSGFAPEGVGQERQYRGSLALIWRPNPHMQVGVIGGVAFAGDLIVEDDDGDRIFKEDYDPTPFLGARMRLEF